jgi:hypothetical protein
MPTPVQGGDELYPLPPTQLPDTGRNVPGRAALPDVVESRPASIRSQSGKRARAVARR